MFKEFTQFLAEWLRYLAFGSAFGDMKSHRHTEESCTLKTIKEYSFTLS